MNYLFYVTGHGFGHARRAAELIRALLARQPNSTLQVRTPAAAWLFEGLGPGVRHYPVDIDPGCAERDLLNIDPRGTAERVETFLARRNELLKTEVAFVREYRIDRILADIAFFAGDVAGETRVPCTAISNFTWDWIYEGLFDRDPRSASMIETIRGSYGRMERLLRLPWGGVADTFPQVLDCPLIATPSRRDRGEIERLAGLDDRDARPRVLVAMRGGISSEAFAAAAKGAPHLLFLHLGARQASFPANVHCVSPTPGGLDFADVLSVSDVVLSKLGYGIVADCLAARKRLLWPRRHGFREDALSEREAAAYIPLMELPTDDFHAGRWGTHLDAILAKPIPSRIARTDGADVCADAIHSFGS